MGGYLIAQLDQLDPVRCPCGWARRAFGGSAQSPASVHQVQIETDARTHYHKKTTEIYIVLEGQGSIELDGQLLSVQPMSAVVIHPGCRHRAVGRLKIINVAIPAFDPDDEWFDGREEAGLFG
jgi:mannose-6-phosphate isomerase-like protein (cupin superfamily)